MFTKLDMDIFVNAGGHRFEFVEVHCPSFYGLEKNYE